MFDIRMLQTLLRSLALMDGVVPFETHKPAIVSAVVAPGIDRYVESQRAHVADKEEWRQGNAAIWAGTVRTVMMLPAGLADFLGPMGEETLGESAVRMAQVTVNGVFSLPTRLANIIVGPASEAPPFDQALAQTE